MAMKDIYKKIVKAIYEKADGDDARPYVRDWIMMFEHFKIKGFSRENFLEACIIEKERRIKNEDKN